ncbi:MAG: CooT family nickel-binding protein [Chloroflexi bacterium]|nr:CooT family nickel-binding protein [Chloroflexota bacterium]
MCLATVYIEENGEMREVMREVAWIRFERDGVWLGQFMGKEELLPLRLKSVDLLHSSVLLTPATEGEKDLLDPSV